MRKLIANLVLDHMIRKFNRLTEKMDEISTVLGYRTDEEGYGPLDRMESGQFPEEEAAINEKENANPEALEKAFKVGMDRLILYGKIMQFADKWGLTVYNTNN